MNWEDLIAIARALAAGAVPPQTGRPGSQHHLLRSIPRPGQQQRQHTDRLRFPSPQRSGMGVVTYRTIDHRSARARCQHPGMSRFPAQIREMAALFARLQARRHQADYAPQAQNPRSQVLQLATETEAAIRAFEAANLNQRRSFAAHLLFRERID